MFFQKYSFCEQNGWNFPEVNFSGINLLVGDSGTGKTRYINVITNLAKQTISHCAKYEGNWNIEFHIKENIYRWKLIVNSDPVPRVIIFPSQGNDNSPAGSAPVK